MRRQKIRKFLLIAALLFFPVTLYYFSPVLMINGAFNQVMNGSFIVFLAMLVLAIPFGRLFCGWLCPAGGLQECLFSVNDKVRPKGWLTWLKYVIWAAWITTVIIFYIKNGGIRSVDFFYETNGGISVWDVQSYLIYYGIVLLIVIPALVGGRRTFCHDFCWMAPFMVIGMKLRRFFKLPGFHMEADPASDCVHCGKCSRACPMGLDVEAFVKNGTVSSPECLNCGTCADTCPKKVWHFSMKKEPKHGQ